MACWFYSFCPLQNCLIFSSHNLTENRLSHKVSLCLKTLDSAGENHPCLHNDRVFFKEILLVATVPAERIWMSLEPFALFKESLQCNGDLGYPSQSSIGRLNNVYGTCICKTLF